MALTSDCDRIPAIRIKKSEALLCFCLVMLVAALLLLGSVPPVSRDALTHHLYVPKLYLEQGLGELPWLKFSYYPMNLDLLYLIPLYFGNDIIPKFIHCGFGLLTGLLIFIYLRKRLGNIYGYAGAIFFLTIPVVVKLAITAYVDLGLVFFSTAALMSLLRWVESGLRLRYAACAAVFCGLALGTKYNGLLVFCILSLLLPLLAMRGRKMQRPDGAGSNAGRAGQGRIWLHWGLFVALALFVYSPWMVRNYVWTGNPLYPLYQSAFNAPGQPPDAAENRSVVEKQKPPVPKARANPFILRRQIYNESGLEILLIPLRIFFQGQDDNPKYFDGQLTPLLLLLPLAAFGWGRPGNRHRVLEKSAWLIFAVLYLLIAFVSTDMRIRYLAPILPALTILSMFGLRNLFGQVQQSLIEKQRKYIKYLIVLAFLGIWFHQLGYIAKQYRLYRPDLYLSGQVSRDAFIESFRPEYAVMRFANQQLPSDARIFGIYLGGRGYYSDRDIRFGNLKFERIVSRTDSPEAIARRLTDRGYTHILINLDLFNRWSAPKFTPRQIDNLKAFFDQQSRRLYRKASIALYQIEG